MALLARRNLTTKKKKGHVIFMILKWILIVLVVLHIIGFVVAQITKNETSKIKPYGTLVKTSHGRMHLYEMGDKSKETIIILPGFGDALPSADFAPLMRDLSKDYHVICAEYLGGGFSDDTTEPRDSKHFVSELREALDEFGCKPPYIMMPHSCSGIYCEYYANKYPKEISKLIELDCTSTASDNAPVLPGWYCKLSRFQQICGVTRLMYWLMPSMQKQEYGYTEEEQRDYKTFCYHTITPSFASQNSSIPVDVKEVRSMPFPSTIPVLKLYSEQSVKRFGDDYQKDHLKRLGSNASSYMIKGSEHMMHEKDHQEIAEKAKEFIEK